MEEATVNPELSSACGELIKVRGESVETRGRKAPPFIVPSCLIGRRHAENGSSWDLAEVTSESLGS